MDTDQVRWSEVLFEIFGLGPKGKPPNFASQPSQIVNPNTRIRAQPARPIPATPIHIPARAMRLWTRPAMIQWASGGMIVSATTMDPTRAKVLV